MKYIDIDKYTKQDYRQKQIQNAIFKQFASDWSQIQTLPKDLRRKLQKEIEFPTIIPITSKPNLSDNAVKILFETKKDEKTFEGVLLQHQDGRRTVCLSTQIGCPMNCIFCATGKMELARNLEHREIIDQVLYFAHQLKKNDERVSNIVYMGMGEPFLNPRNTLRSVQILNDPYQFGLGARSITISTVGIVKPMKEFFTKFPQVNLAVSLHSAIPEVRKRLMPVASKTSLEDLADYIRFHINQYNRRVSLEYLLLNDINDGEDDIKALIEFIENIGKNARKLLHVNLIPYNQIENNNLLPTPHKKVINFRNKLKHSNIQVTIRKSLGQKKKAACGMLKTQNN
jgi:23S rRNA (adenine(2503)-C(2))-methyltransferase